MAHKRQPTKPPRSGIKRPVAPRSGIKGAAPLRDIRLWFEINDGRKAPLQAALLQASAAMRAIRPVTRKVCVTVTESSYRLVLPELRRRFPDFDIMPSLKLITTVGKLDQVEQVGAKGGWRRVAEIVKEIYAWTGHRYLLLEAESLVLPYVKSNRTRIYDGRKFIDGLLALPTGPRYLWYPSIHAGTESVRERQFVICLIAYNNLDCSFTCHRKSRPYDDKPEWVETSYGMIRAINRRRPFVWHIHLTDTRGIPNDTRWPLDRTREALTRTPYREPMLVFPGSTKLVVTARAIAKVMAGGK